MARKIIVENDVDTFELDYPVNSATKSVTIEAVNAVNEKDTSSKKMNIKEKNDYHTFKITVEKEKYECLRLLCDINFLKTHKKISPYRIVRDIVDNHIAVNKENIEKFAILLKA
jgi:hypothetical protein